jgi:glutamyl-tRNA reductase
LQHHAEELRQAEMRRMISRLGPLTPEQSAAVEALTRGLVNKLLHQPMQAIKQAARENDLPRLEALCDTWSLPAVQPPGPAEAPSADAPAAPANAEKPSEAREAVRQ